MTDRLKRTLIAGAAGATLATGGAAIAGAASGDEERPITGAALDRASAAALEHTGGGRVTETESGDEEGAYEVEVTLDDGRRVDVHLDRAFHVLGQKADDGPDDR
jgi:uncharacterized membrane protein YkoI